eukprot:PhF_6_TR37620/c0_g1_i2/m.55919
MSKKQLVPPCDVWTEVFLYVDDGKFICQLCRVSKVFHEIIVMDDVLWKQMFQRTFPTLSKSNQTSAPSFWYECFVRETQHFGIKTIPKKPDTRSTFEKMKQWFSKPPPQRRIIFCGMSYTGKTTILQKLNLGVINESYPTMGFSVKSIETPLFNYVCWTVAGGGMKLRPLLRHYYDGTAAVVFIVDSTDLETMDLVKEELQCMMREELLKDAAVLIYWNRIDVLKHMSLQVGIQTLDLHVVLQNHRYNIYYMIKSSVVYT